MTIGIVTGFSSRDAAGLETFLLEMLTALERVRPSGVEYVVYTSSGNDLDQALAARNLRAFRIIHIGFGRFWKYIGLWFAPRADHYIYNGPLAPPFLLPGPATVIVYDFAYKQNAHTSLPPRLNEMIMDFLSRRVFHQAQNIVAISQTTARETTRLFGVLETRIQVIYAGYKDVSLIPEESIEIPKEGYFLFVGTVKERKNVLNLVRGYVHAVTKYGIKESLLIAGRYDRTSPYVKKIREVIDAANLSDRIFFLGSITDGQLHFLYRHALAFSFPSKLEGFGMPILEAMKCGTPVLTSTASSLPEVAGDAALLVNPDDPDAIGDGLERLSKDEKLRTELIQKGFIRAGMFSWDKSALSLLSTALSGRRTPDKLNILITASTLDVRSGVEGNMSNKIEGESIHVGGAH
ncbi:MAG: glycosyltransferase family 4 protein [Minisyncoccota bacterium]